MAKGLIVYFDGPDGVGKTTQLELVREALGKAGHAVHETRTLGGTPIGESLRDVILSDAARPVETDLYIALAIQYALAEDILVRRHSGEIVLVDRSPLSIVAYQVYGDGLPKDLGYGYARKLMDYIRPDLTLVYQAAGNDLSGRRRLRNEQAGHDHFEKMPPDYHQRTIEGFAEAAREFNAVLIDASESSEHVFASTIKQLHAALDQ